MGAGGGGGVSEPLHNPEGIIYACAHTFLPMHLGDYKIKGKKMPLHYPSALKILKWVFCVLYSTLFQVFYNI